MINLRKIKNLLKKKEKDYKSNISYSNIEYDILVVSCPNIQQEMESEERVNLMYTMSHLVIEFTIENPNDTKDSINILYQSCIKHNISIFNNFDYIVIWSNYDKLTDMVYLANSSLQSNDNEFFIILRNILDSVSDNMLVYINDELSYELIELKDHRSFKMRYDDYIRKNPTEPIEILGYTFIPSGIDILSEVINCIWISIHEDIINEFSSISANMYKEEGKHRVLIKMNLYDFISQMNKNITTISKDTFITIRNICSNDEYFNILMKYINWNKYYDFEGNELIKTKDNIDYNNNENDMNEEGYISQEEFINEVLDEIIK